MKQISLNHFKISTLLMAFTFFLNTSAPMASMSVYHKGNPKKYALASESKGQWSIKPLKTKGELNVTDAVILLEGADFKKGDLSLNSKRFGKASLSVTDAFLGKGGIFNCKGVLKVNGHKKELFFDVTLEPIKKGFIYTSEIKFAQEDFKLKLYKKNKKAYDDVSFKFKIKLLEK